MRGGDRFDLFSRHHFAHRPFTLDEILEALAQIGVPEFAAEARLAFP